MYKLCISVNIFVKQSFFDFSCSPIWVVNNRLHDIIDYQVKMIVFE